MRVLILLCSLAMFFWTAPAVFADIYVWTDANGVKNFTNNAPPEQAVVFMETPEIEVKAPVSETIPVMESDDAEALHAEELQAAQKEIEALAEQVAGLRRELQDALEPVPEQPPIETTEVVESTNRFGYGTVYRSGYYRPYDPYGFLWYHKVKRHHRRPGYGHGGPKKALPYKHRITHLGPKKRFERRGVRSDRHRPGYRKSRSMMRRAETGASHRVSGQRMGYQGGMRPRR